MKNNMRIVCVSCILLSMLCFSKNKITASIRVCDYDAYAEKEITGIIDNFLTDLNCEKEVLSITKGFVLENADDYEKIVYFVKSKDQVKATFIVSNLNGILSGYLTTLWTDQVNKLYNIYGNDIFIKLRMIRNTERDTVFALYNDSYYDLNVYDHGSISISTKEASCESNQLRLPTTYYRSWTVYESGSSTGVQCFKYCSYNIYI